MSSVERIVALMGAVGSAPSPGIGVTAAATASGLPKAASHRILKALTAARMVTFDDASKLYALGPQAVTIGLAALRQLDVPRLARPHLQALVEATGETATLSMRQGFERVYLQQVLSPREVRMTVRIGDAYPLHAGATSKAILVGLNQQELHDYFDHHRGTERFTEQTIIDPLHLRDEVEEGRALGYTSSHGERQADAASVAAPILLGDGAVFGALSVCGPLQRFERSGVSTIGRLARSHAAQLSRKLGYVDPPPYEHEDPFWAGPATSTPDR